MNREQKRRAARLAKKPFKPQLGQRHFGNAPLQLLDDCRQYDEGDLTMDHIKIRSCFGRLRDGSATEDDFNRVGVAINLAKARALEIDEILADHIEVAQDAMMRCKARFGSHGRFGFDGPGYLPYSTHWTQTKKSCETARQSRWKRRCMLCATFWQAHTEKDRACLR